MKRFSFLQVVVLAALLVTVASCGAPMYSEGDPYGNAPAQANVYYGDPYYGGVNTIVVERDPYTGQYYQVSPGYYGSGVYSTPGNRYYSRRYNNNNNRHYNNNNRDYNTNRNYSSGNNGYYKTYPQNQRQQQQVQPQRTPVQQTPQFQQQRSEAKGAILGKKRS
jgi:hypothetical protein